jgi:hypothetical protein
MIGEELLTGASYASAPAQAILSARKQRLWPQLDIQRRGHSCHLGDSSRVTGKPEVETDGLGGHPVSGADTTMILPGETEVGFAGTQPRRGIARLFYRCPEKSSPDGRNGMTVVRASIGFTVPREVWGAGLGTCSWT